MAEQLIISYTDVNEFWPLSKHIDNDKIEANILRSQQADLKPVLGDPLYYAFIEDYDSPGVFTSPQYQKLFDGGEYLYNNETIYFSGCRSLLASFAYNRISAINKINVVRGGTVVKTIEQSETGANADIRHASRKAFEEATRIEKEVLQFLYTERSSYPLFTKRIETKQKRTSYNFYRV